MGFFQSIANYARRAIGLKQVTESLPEIVNYPANLMAQRLLGYLATRFPTLQDRRYGSNKLDLFSRERLVAVARDMELYNPYAQGFLDTLSTFVIGKGNKYDAAIRDKHEDDAQAELWREQAQLIIDGFEKRAKWRKREKEAYRRLKRDGEYFLHFQDTDAGPNVRFIEPEYVKSPDGSIEWRDGIKCGEDSETALAYWVDANLEADPEEVSADEVIHEKANVDLCIRRGVSDFAATAEIIESAFTTARNAAKSSAYREGVTYVVEHAEAEVGDVEAYVQGETSYVMPPTAPVAPYANPKGQAFTTREGVGAEHIPEGMKLASAPDSTTIAGSVQAVNMALLAVGRKYNMPLWMLSGDASNNGFASALVAESPLSRSIECEQEDALERGRAVMRKVLEMAVDAGRLDAEALDVIEVKATAHSAIPRDLKTETDRNEKLYDRHVIGLQEWSSREGIDYDQMRSQIKEEAQRDKVDGISPPQILHGKAVPLQLDPAAPPGQLPGGAPAAPPSRIGTNLNGRHASN